MIPNDGPTPRSDANPDIKVRQIQQYLHRPGQIPASLHPFVKHAARQATSHQSQPQRPLSQGQRMAQWRDRLVLGGGVVRDAIAIGVPWAIASLFQRIGRRAK